MAMPVSHHDNHVFFVMAMLRQWSPSMAPRTRSGGACPIIGQEPGHTGTKPPVVGCGRAHGWTRSGGGLKHGIHEGCPQGARSGRRGMVFLEGVGLAEILVMLYALVASAAMAMTWREGRQTGGRSPLAVAGGMLACALWPLACAAMLVAVRRRAT